MAQSLSLNIVHIIFSTKGRRPILNKTTRQRLFPYLAELIRDKACECFRVGGVEDGVVSRTATPCACECFRVGGVEDHIHIAVRLSPIISISKLVAEMKTGTTHWLKRNFPEHDKFSWQNGYGAFSVGPNDLQAVVQYIDNQENHHKTITFQDEFRKFLTKYGLEFDEQYVWG